MRAVVLSGGGSKGSYQVGAWKALRKLHIKYDIVTGTSVGALNGAMMVQKDYWRAIKVWKKLNLKLLFGNEAENVKHDKNMDVFKMYKDNFIKNGGMEVKLLEELIDKELNKKKFYNSNINYGLVTYNVNKMKPLSITKNKIPKDKLVDYLMASASCYPAFQQKDIDGKKYIDGGFFDNLPINLALEMGADEIIAIDLSAPGLNRTPIKKVPTIHIKPNNKLSFFLNFNAEEAKRNMLFGYNDTMKAFNKLEGKYFSFKKGEINKCLEHYKDSFEYHLKSILGTNKTFKNFIALPLIVKIYNSKNLDKYALEILEKLGNMFELEQTKIYKYKKFTKTILRQANKDIKDIELSFPKKYLKSKSITLDLYQKIIDKKYDEVKKSVLITPYEFLCAVFLYTMRED